MCPPGSKSVNTIFETKIATAFLKVSFTTFRLTYYNHHQVSATIQKTILYNDYINLMIILKNNLICQ